MKAYDSYDIDDFVSNDAFVQWCLEPSEELEAFWGRWMLRNPDKQVIVDAARKMVMDLNQVQKEENLELENSIWESIAANVVETPPSKKVVRKLNLKYALAFAAGFLFLASLTYLINLQAVENQTNTISSAFSKVQTEWINLHNDSGQEMNVNLDDGSTIQLSPYGFIKYPSKFTKSQREVFLRGEAFFDIKRDTTKPFLVYANETVTKVLGTSFTIKAFEGEETVEVEVKTGKVAVYAQVESASVEQKQMVVLADEKILVPRPNKKIEVKPNHKVVFDRSRSVMEKSIADEPILLQSLQNIPELSFNNQSIVQVFDALEEVYGVVIECDIQQLQKCNITTLLRDEPLFQKLDILCSALNLKYVIDADRIVISGAGCKGQE